MHDTAAHLIDRVFPLEVGRPQRHRERREVRVRRGEDYLLLVAEGE